MRLNKGSLNIRMTLILKCNDESILKKLLQT